MKRSKEALVIDTTIEAGLWSAYLENKTDANRNALVELYLPAVQATARVIKSSFARRSITLDAGDLAGEGMIGLMSMIDKFDPSLGFKFMTFAQARIRGAMVDSVRQQDWVPRSERRARADTPALLSADLAQDQVDASVASEDGELLSAECSDEATKLWRALSPLEREIIDLYLVKKEKIGRVAARCSCSPAFIFDVVRLAERYFADLLGLRETSRAATQGGLQSAV